MFQKLSVLHWQALKCEWRRYLLFFRNLFLFVYRHSDLEGSCSNGTKTRHGESRCCLRAIVGHKIWHWAGRFETFTERNCWAYDACAGEVWTEGGFTLALFQQWVWGGKYCCTRCNSILAFESSQFFRGRLGDNTFSKMCVFKSLIGYTDYGGYENQNAHF
jgi:hypothetical protein